MVLARSAVAATKAIVAVTAAGLFFYGSVSSRVSRTVIVVRRVPVPKRV